MKTVAELLKSMLAGIVSISPYATVLDAVRPPSEEKIGSLLVMVEA